MWLIIPYNYRKIVLLKIYFLTYSIDKKDAYWLIGEGEFYSSTTLQHAQDNIIIPSLSSPTTIKRRNCDPLKLHIKKR